MLTLVSVRGRERNDWGNSEKGEKGRLRRGLEDSGMDVWCGISCGRNEKRDIPRFKLVTNWSHWMSQDFINCSLWGEGIKNGAIELSVPVRRWKWRLWNEWAETRQTNPRTVFMIRALIELGIAPGWICMAAELGGSEQVLTQSGFWGVERCGYYATLYLWKIEDINLSLLFFWATSGSAPGLFLSLYLGITPGRVWGIII